MEQARQRSDKGVEAAEAAIEMANLRRRLRRGRR
jgi:6,7-dimethyl-8-ribityllumazine synthase